MKKLLVLPIIAILLCSSVTVNAAPSETAKKTADFMMSRNADGAPNWFNGAYYSANYEDLKVAFNTNESLLYNHILQYGFNEQRLVTPVLNVVKYRANNADLEEAFGNNWELYIRHYFEYGINEGRNNFTDFDAATYLKMHADLQNAFGNDLVLATRHYLEYGISEERNYIKPTPQVETVTTPTYSEKNEELPDGTIIVSIYKDGKLTTEKQYFEDVLIEMTEFDDNEMPILIKMYGPDGTLYSTTIYEYDENGNLACTRTSDADGTIRNATYENGELITDEYFWPNGFYAYITYENAIRTYQIDIHSDGTRFETYYYSDGYTRSKSTELCTDGTKYIVEFYENGNRKSDKHYDANGILTSEHYYNEDGTLITPPSETPSETPSEDPPSEVPPVEEVP